MLPWDAFWEPKMRLRPDLRPGPAGEPSQHSPDPLAGFFWGVRKRVGGKRRKRKGGRESAAAPLPHFTKGEGLVWLEGESYFLALSGDGRLWFHHLPSDQYIEHCHLRSFSKLPHDNSCVGCTGTEMATSKFLSVEFDDIVEVCWPTLIKCSVHHGGDLKLNSCLHRQPVKTL